MDRRDEAEQSLVSHAEALDPGQLRRVGDRLVHCFDRDRADEQAIRRLERRGLSVAETYDGMVSVNGLLDPVSGALLLTALNAKGRPSSTADHGDGHASAGGTSNSSGRPPHAGAAAGGRPGRHLRRLAGRHQHDQRRRGASAPVGDRRPRHAGVHPAGPQRLSHRDSSPGSVR